MTMNYFLLALLSAFLFGAATPASKALLGSLSSFQLAGLLYLGAALAVIPQSIRGMRNVPPAKGMDRKNQARLFGAVIFGGLLGPVLLLTGLRLASAASVSMWLNLELVATAVLGKIIFRDYLGRFGWLGVVGVLIASILLGAEENMAGLLAGSLVALACSCWAIDNHLTALIDGITPAQSTFWKGIVAGTANFLIGIVAQPLSATPATILTALGVGAFSYGVSIVLYITAAQHIGATRSQLVFAAAPFFGVMLSAILLDERLMTLQLLAFALLAVSVAALFKDRHEHEHYHAPESHRHRHDHNDPHHAHSHASGESDIAHSHWHEHDETAHAHPHWPDLHHRHEH
jgi:drug/metabolite transporter (DMT)-like permease